MSRFTKLAMAGLLAVPVLAFVGTAHAQTGGDPQIERGDIYRVKNTTASGDFVDTTSAGPGDSLTYKVRIHNPGEECLTNVVVRFVLPTAVANKNISTVTVKADEVTTNFVSDTATVNLSSAQAISFVSGSVQLLDSNGTVISTLSNSAVNGSGVNIGKVCVSINEKRFVQFQAKVSKPEQPAVKFACEALGVVKVDRTRFDFTATASVQNANVTSYVFTARDKDGHIVDSKTVNTSALSAVYNFNQSKAGDYTVSVIVNTDKGSTHITDKCTQKVTVVKEDEKPTPEQPEEKPEVKGEVTELPNTGAAAIGVFAGASVLGTAGHYLFRRFRA